MIKYDKYNPSRRPTSHDATARHARGSQRTARSEITPYPELTGKLMLAIAAKSCLWAGDKTENIIIHLNANTPVGRDLRARHKKKNQVAALPYKGRPAFAMLRRDTPYFA